MVSWEGLGLVEQGALLPRRELSSDKLASVKGREEVALLAEEVRGEFSRRFRFPSIGPGSRLHVCNTLTIEEVSLRPGHKFSLIATRDVPTQGKRTHEWWLFTQCFG